MYLEEGGVKPEPVEIPVAALLEEAVNSVPALASNIRVHQEISSDTAPVRIVPGQVTDVLRNLLTNAVEAIQGEGVITLAH